MSRQLEPNELFCFGFSYFDCEARRREPHGIIVEEIEVTITMFRGMMWGFIIKNPTLTTNEIKELTAYRILELVRCCTNEVRDFAKQAMEESM